jgi:hypothetical protein
MDLDKIFPFPILPPLTYSFPGTMRKIFFSFSLLIIDIIPVLSRTDFERWIIFHENYRLTDPVYCSNIPFGTRYTYGSEWKSQFVIYYIPHYSVLRNTPVILLQHKISMTVLYEVYTSCISIKRGLATPLWNCGRKVRIEMHYCT